MQSVARGVRDAAVGAYNVVRHPIDTAQSIAQVPSQIAQVPAAIHDINQSADPVGTYAKVAQDTAGQGAGQAILAAGTAGAAKAVPATAGAISDAIPSAERAGVALGDVKATAGSVPIAAGEIGDTALELYTQSQRGGDIAESRPRSH